MKQIFKVFCILSLFILFVTAQQNTRTLEVKGLGTYKAMPDIGVLTIEATIVNPKFADAVKGLNTKTEQLITQLQTVGFKRDAIKTTDFSVAKNLVWENNKNVEKGYIARQNITVEFPNTKEKIGAIITLFMNSENDVRFTFNFILSAEKERQVNDALLTLAIRNAQSRAELIVATAKQTIGAIHRITYGMQNAVPMYKSAMMMNRGVANDESLGFDVKEMTLTDEVTIVWELK
jgi:uncharacterized protein YggE